MRFEGEEMDEEPTISEDGSPWYFFVPPAVVGVWLSVAAARVVVYVLVPPEVAGTEGSGLLGDVLQGVDVLGGLGWVLLFVFYFALLARRRRSRWWAVGGLCCALTLPLYITLLLLPPRRPPSVAPDLPELVPFGTEKRLRVASAGLRDSFVCDGCGSLLNYGVSECGDCGERYTYRAGTAQVEDSAPRRRR